MSVCNCKCVILQTKRARCAIRKSLIYLMREAFLELAVVELVYKLDEKPTASV